MKKLTMVLATTALLLMGTTTAFAHCGGGGHHRGGISYSTCNYEDCNLDYNHMHDGCYYYGHYNGDGHSYHCY